MANILDYLDWRGDLTFEQSPFNEVDNLLLSQLVYVDLEGIVVTWLLHCSSGMGHSRGRNSSQ